jgi:hypothetical protein
VAQAAAKRDEAWVDVALADVDVAHAVSNNMA